MLRSTAAVVFSYIAMAIIVVVAFAGLWLGLGPDRLLEPGTWKGNMILTIGAPAITVVAGLFGGWMCAKIGRDKRSVISLATLVLVLGMIMAYFTLQKPEPTGPRDPGLTMEQIMEKGREPTWVAISNPILGAVAVLIAGLGTAARRRPN
jgi:uncharacterized membrane protein